MPPTLRLPASRAILTPTIYEDGANTITLWRWERGLRHSITRFELRVREALDVISHIDRGQDDLA